MPDFKSLFGTPQKARLTILCLLVALATLAAIVVYIVYSHRDVPDAAPQPTGTASVPQESERPMGLTPSKTLEEARLLALTDAGVAASQAQFSQAELGEDHGIWVYRFRFQTRNASYTYQINANTGAVHSKEVGTFVTYAPESAPPESSPEPVDTAPAETAPRPDESAAPPPENTPPASAAPEPSSSQAPETMYIGMQRAKAIALSHAGLSSSRVMFTRLGMSREEGQMVYRVEFRQNGTAYQYRIDAATGRVLHHEQKDR